MPYNRETDALARQLDSADKLARFRESFYLCTDTIYLDGNSLGLMCKEAEASLLAVLDDWKNHAINGWTGADRPWFTLAESLAAQTAPLVGADSDEVIVTNSTTVNLHQLLATLFQPDGQKSVILADELNFPSDLYAIHSHLRLRGLNPEKHLRHVRSRDGFTLEEGDIIAEMTDEVALIMLPSILYSSGQLLDMPRLADEAGSRNILIGFDCSHSVGAIPHRLSEWSVDFAFWCSYKYLNSGPGAAGGLFLNKKHFGRQPGLAGWFGNRKATQFDMRPMLDPEPNAAGLQIGTPNILSMAPLVGSLGVIEAAGIEEIRTKSLNLTSYLLTLADANLAEFGFQSVTPGTADRRGGHVALTHPEATRICKALKAVKVIPDLRPPNIVRLAPVALYTSFQDCYEAVRRLRSIMETGAYLEFPTQREFVS